MEDLEKKLEVIFVKKAPYQIPEKGRKWIAEYAWVFALAGLIFGGLAALSLLAVVGLVSAVGVAIGAGGYVLLSWLSLIALVAYLVVLAMALPKLKAKQRAGWQLIYYSTLFFLVYDVLNWLAYIRLTPSIFSLIWYVVSVGIALYVLFQVRSEFK